MTDSVFDLDSSGASGFEPVTVRFRGNEYTLGATAYGLVAAPAILTPPNGEASERETLVHIVQNIHSAVRVLSPPLAEALEADDNVTPGETLALVRAVMEVLNRLGRFRFSAEEEEGGGGEPGGDS